MNVLPWLLDWPPTPAKVAGFVLLTAFSLGTLVVFGGLVDEPDRENVTVESIDVTVRLNDDVDRPDGDGGVQTCLASGTPGDRVAVLGDVTLAVPADRGRDRGEAGLSVAVSLAHTAATTAETVEGAGRVTSDVFWVFEDDESLAVGDAASVAVRVRDGDATVANATRQVPVENGTRSYDC